LTSDAVSAASTLIIKRWTEFEEYGEWLAGKNLQLAGRC
jgi:hypothetical protein